MTPQDELVTWVTQLTLSRAAKLGLDTSDAEFVGSAIEEVKMSILNYCNISSIPEELKFDWTNMVLDLLRWWDSQSKSSGTGTGDPTIVDEKMVVTSLREGSVSVSLKAASELETSPTMSRSITGVLDEIVTNYTDHLNRFRRMSWF